MTENQSGMLERSAGSQRMHSDDVDSDMAFGDLFGLATGVHLGVFSPNHVSPPAVCLATCLHDWSRGLFDGGCQLIQSIASTQDASSIVCPSHCDKGFRVSVHAGQRSTASYFVVEETADAVDEASAARAKAVALLGERCRQLEAENEGLGTEVIHSYEQLNVVFDVSQQIYNVPDTAQIKHYLIGRLAQTLSCEWSCCLAEQEGVLWWNEDNTASRDDALALVNDSFSHLIEQARQKRGPVVYNRPFNGPVPDWPALLVCPMVVDESDVDLMIFARSMDMQEFSAGEMQLTDSVLQHSQQVISKLRLIERLRSMSFGAVHALVSAIDKKDNYTSGHSERVGFLSRIIGEALGLSAEQLQDLEWAGLLHDVGKIGIQDGVLTKPGGLSDEEFDHIKQHATMSYEIVAPIEAFSNVRDVVLHHHELPDGSGYPAGLKGDEIPLMARVVHVADTFDALTSTRSYRKAFSFEKAIEIMKKDCGPKLDEEVTAAFLTAIEAFRTEQPDRFWSMFGHLREVE